MGKLRMTRPLIILIFLFQGCSYTVPLGTGANDGLKKTQIDKLTESGDYQTYPKEVIAPVEKGFNKLKPGKEKPECTSDVTPGSASNFSNCKY